MPWKTQALVVVRASAIRKFPTVVPVVREHVGSLMSACVEEKDNAIDNSMRALPYDFYPHV
jgi:hypothetical protein